MPEAIDTAAKRAKLAPRKNPYWQGLSGGRGGLSLGYRKPAKGSGSWVAKLVVDGRRAEERIGLADDEPTEPNAISFVAATAASIEWGKRQAAGFEAERKTDPKSSAPTVRSAVEAYMKMRAARPANWGTEKWLKRHLLDCGDRLADVRLSRLSARDILDWRATLPEKLRPSTKNRILNDVRAALNAAVAVHRRQLPAYTSLEIKVGTKAEEAASEARRQLLSDEQIRAVVRAAFDADPDEDFGRLVLLLAATGARFSQLAALTVGDVQVRNCRVMVPSSRKGKKRVRKQVPVPVQSDVIERLRPAIDGRGSNEPLLMRWGYVQITATRWTKANRQPWRRGHEHRKMWSAAVKSAELPSETVMYALRHSSIVRALLKGLPVRLVAALHDTSVPMIERHYAAHITDMSDDMAREAAIGFAAPEQPQAAE